MTPKRLPRLHQRPKKWERRKNCTKIIENAHVLDFDQKLNTSSYVNVEFEDEEAGASLPQVNLADQTVYPQSYKLHDTVVNMIANLWHCPKPADFDDTHVYPGAGTVGSTEAHWQVWR